MVFAAVLLPLLLLQTESPNDKEQTKRWMQFYATTAGDYRIFLDKNPEVPLEFNAASILQYTNPERARGQHGAVFVWTYQGRPEAIGTIWSIRDRRDATKRRTSHEFHSLSLSPLRSQHPEIIGLGNKGKMPQWRAAEAGIELASFPNAPRAASSQTARLVQMRRLARDLDGIRIDQDDSEVRLRLLPQPLVRYASKATGVVDGALFGLASGTDPELFLLIELRETQGGTKWQFAACRCTGRPLRLRLDRRTVWECDRAQTWEGNRPYFFCVGVSEHNAELPPRVEE